MRLAVVGHTYILAVNQEKYVAMRRLDPRLELRLIVPRRVRNDSFHEIYSPERHRQLATEEVVPLSAAPGGSHVTAVYNPLGLARVLARFRPDVVHVEEEPQSAVTLEAVIARAAFAPDAALTIFSWDNLLRRRRFPLGAIKSALRRFALRRADFLLCGSREAEDLARREGRIAATEVVPQLGLDPDAHLSGTNTELRRQLGFAESGVVVGFAGRLLPEKGLRLLLEALASLADRPWQFLIVGTGPLEREIREQWIPRFPGRIVHVQVVPHREVPRYLRCADIFVLNSYSVPQWKEQFGLALAQAMMLGIPSIVSDSGALPEVAGNSALVVAERSVPELRAALAALIVSPALRRELGDRARARAIRLYTNDVVAARTYQVFERALVLRAGPRTLSHFARRGCSDGVNR
jgi:glycosyltransferase involved in cell wall biosynthesis